MKKDKKRLSLYMDELDKMELEQIEKIDLPWQRNFLLRFYEQLKKQNLQKLDVVQKIKKNPNKLLSSNYNMPANTLTQYTRFNSKNMRPINVNNLIAISSALNVSVDYLLGIESCENHQNTDINKVTGLSNEAIEILKKNTDMQEALNYFLQSSLFNELIQELEKSKYTELISHDILNAYSEFLYNKIVTAYQNYIRETSPIEIDIEKYKEYLRREIPFTFVEEIGCPLKTFLKNNLSDDMYNNIFYEIEENIDDWNIYNTFINQTADFLYNILEYKFSKESRINRYFQIFEKLFESYVNEQVRIHEQQKIKK